MPNSTNSYSLVIIIGKSLSVQKKNVYIGGVTRAGEVKYFKI